MQAYLRAASTLSVTELPPATANSQFHPVTARFAGLHCTSARSLGRTNSSMGTAMGSNSELVLKKKFRFRLALHASHRSQLRSHMPFTVLAVVHAWSLGQGKLQNEQHNDEQSVLHGHRQAGKQAATPALLTCPHVSCTWAKAPVGQPRKPQLCSRNPGRPLPRQPP